MQAREAVDGQEYNLPAIGQYPPYKGAVCNGWNHTHEWLLFVVFDEEHKRRVRMVVPNTTIQPL